VEKLGKYFQNRSEMPTYTFQSPNTGESYDVEFDGTPNEADLEEVRMDLELREQDTGQSFGEAALNEAVRGVAGIPKGIVGGAGAVGALIPGLEDNALLRGAESFQSGYESALPVNPAQQDNFAVKAAGAAGQGLGFLGTTYLTAGFGATPAIARGVGLGAAGLMGAEQGAQTAEQYGLTDWTDRAAMTLGGAGIEAITEMPFGIGSKGVTEAILGRLKSATRPGNVITRGAKTIAGEGGEEIVAGQAQDFLTGALVEEDPNRPGFATNGVPLPPDTFTMENLKNRLEEGALGAIGGAVFAGAEALGSRTPIDEALAARFQARTRLEELRQKDSLTTEEQDELSQIEAEDQNVAAWLNRQGIDRIRPIVDQFSQNPQSLAEALAANAERQGREREAAMWRSERGVEQATDEISEYKGLVDALYDAESAGNEAAVTMAQQAIDDHVMNRLLNETNRNSQERSLDRTYKDKVAKLREGIKAAQQAANPVQQAADQLVSQVAQEAPQSAQALDSILKTATPQVVTQTTQAQSGPAITPASVSAEQLEVVRKIKKGDAYKLTDDELRSVGLMRDPNGKIANAQIKQGDPEPLAKIVKGLVTISPSVDSTTTPPQTNASAIQSSTQMGGIPSGPEGTGEGGTAGMAVLNQGQAPAGTSPQEEVNAPVPPSTQQPPLAQPAAEEDYALPPLKSQLNKGPVAREDAEFAKESYLQANPERAPFLQNAWIGSTQELAQDRQVRDAVIAGRNMGRENPLTPAQEEQEWRLFLMRRHEGFQFGDRPYILLDRVVVTDRDLRRSIKYGMKPEQWAVRRLIAHEDRHVLTNFLAANDELGSRFRELAARIPDAQLDDLANRRYPEFSDWRTSEIAKRSLQLEWFSEQAESDSPTDPTLLQQFLELLRELYAKVMGISPEDVQDVELRQFLKRASQLQAQYAQQQLGSGIQEGFQASMPEKDAEYMAAVERGDMETAQRMVDEAAKRAGYNVGPVYHGTSGKRAGEFPFTVFDTKKRGDLTSQANDPETGTFFTDKFQYALGAATYQSNMGRSGKPVVGSFFLKNPKVPLVGDGFGATEYLATDPSQIKSADPITRDEQGNVIPLSQRFNPATPDIRFSMPEDSGYNYPPVPDTPDNFQDWIPVVDKARAKQLAWESFYRSNADENGNVDLPALTAAWKQEIARPDSPYLDAGQTEAFMEARRRPAEVYDAPRELTPPETGPRQTKRKAPAKQPTPEDITSRYPQFSQPELSPEERKARLQSISEALGYQTSPVQEEGQTPTQATQDDRRFLETGEPVEFYRMGTTEAGRNALAEEEMGLLIQESPDGPSQELGRRLMDYLSGKSPNIFGHAGNEFSRLNLLNYLDRNPYLRGVLWIDGEEVNRVRSQLASGAGAALQAMRGVYEPMQKLVQNAKEVTDKTAKEELGTSNYKEVAAGIGDEYVRLSQDNAKENITAPVKTSILEAAQNDADELMELGLSGMDPKLAAKIREINERTERLGQLRALERKLLSGSEGFTQASLPELPENMTLAQVRAMISKDEKDLEKLVREVAEEQKKADRKPRPKKQKVENNASFSEYVGGKETAGLQSFDDLMRKYIQPSGFNRDAFTSLLTNKFEDADPNFILGVVNRFADLLNGSLTDESLEADAAKKPNLDARAKRIIARSLALGSQPEDQQKADAFKDLTIQRLKEEISDEEYRKKLEGMGIEAETAFAMNRKVEEDTARRKEADVVRKARAEAKKNADAAKREAEKWAKKTESTIAQLAREFSDTLENRKPQDIDEYKALLNNYIGKGGPPISDEEFIERAKKLNIPEQGYTRLMGVLDMQRRRATAVADAKNRQKAAEKAAKDAQKELEKHHKEVESKISQLSKEFSDTLPAQNKQRELTELQRLINDYTGKNGPIISEEAFDQRASQLNLPEGMRDRLRGVLQMQRKRESLVADTKFRQKEAERLQKELETNDREAQREIDRFAKEFSDTRTEAAKKFGSDLKLLKNDFLGKSGPPISEAQFLERAAALNLKPQNAQSLLRMLQEARRRDTAVRYAKASQQAQEAKRKAIESMVKKLSKVKNPTPQQLKKRSKFINLVAQAMNSGILESESVRAALAEAYDLHGLTEERVKELGDLYKQIDAMPGGMAKETLHLQLMQLLNDLAPASSISSMAFSAYMGYVLQGAGTMLMQTSNLLNFLSPFAFAHNVGRIYASTQGNDAKKLFSALNLRRNFQLTAAGMKEAWENAALIKAGLSGIKTSTGQGLGVTPTELTQSPFETSLAWTPWGQIGQFRMDSNKLMKSMGVLSLFKAARFPAWMASRSFQVIRGAEGWSGGVEKNMAFRQIAVTELQRQGKTYDEAWRIVSDALSPKTNDEMWKDAYKQADEDIKNGLVNKAARKQRATELVQDELDKKWDLMLADRHRQQSAVANFKTDPLTPLGAGAYKLVSMALEHHHWGPVPNPLRFGFLFPRFFINAMETSFMYSPVGLMTSLALPKDLPESKLKERQQRIIEIYGSLSNYRDARIGKSLAGTTVMAGVGALMAAAMQMWDEDDDEPPIFWISGDLLGRYDRRGTLAETGWWTPNTMYIMGQKFNYVNASPQFSMILNAAGNLGDRFMFPKLLKTKLNARTKELEYSVGEAWVRPFGEALAAPMSRSTYRTFYDALDNAMGGDFKKLIRLATQPATGTATALTLGAIPSLKTFEKAEKSQIQPRSPQDIGQTLQAGVPFANSMGLDTGKPLFSVFGEPLTPYHFLTVAVNEQQTTPEARQAARVLIDLGISKNPQKFEYLGNGAVEIAYDGKFYLLSNDQRNEVIKQIGQGLAASIVREKDKLKKLQATKGRNAVNSRIDALADEARKKALRGVKGVE
jgi:hypothetical protein